nr:hypothetical protein [Micromonospora sp. DSM 115978]
MSGLPANRGEVAVAAAPPTATSTEVSRAWSDDGFQRLTRALHQARSELAARPATAEVAAALEREPGWQLRPQGRARKVSVSIPEDLTSAVRDRVGRGAFSQYVTAALARQLEVDMLAELAALLDAEHGPVPDDLLEEARREWPDYGRR